jgi:gliding motility-associated protein GldM
MSLPKEPRQKMINIMYLVLTAILALNISAEILNAFKTVDRSLMTANGIAEQKSKDLFISFDKKMHDDKTDKVKAQEWYDKAQKVKVLSDEVYTFIEGLKHELKVEAKLKKNEKGEEEYKEDDQEATTRLFAEDKPEGKGRGTDLFNKLDGYRKAALAIDPEMAKEVGPTLPLDLTPMKSNNHATNNSGWAYGYFHMAPAVAGITILSKFENDVRNSEAQMIEYCHRRVGQVEVVYDAFQAFAGTNSQYLMPGEELVITAGVGAFSKEAKPSITVDGTGVALKPDGTAEYKSTVGVSGSFTKRVIITYTKPDGTKESKPVDVKYTVGVPSGLVVSTDKTRVFYQNLQNELRVTGGSGDEKVTVNVEGPGVSVTKSGPGNYIVNCANLGTATVTASDGKTSQKILIPIKPVPLPLAQVGGKGGGVIAPNVFRVQKGVAAELKDFIFEGVKYEVVSFTMYCTGKGFEDNPGIAEVTGAYFNADAQAQMRKCQAGTTVVIDDIKVRGPGGATKLLDQNISFTLQ